MIRPVHERGMKGWKITCDSCEKVAHFYVDTAREAFGVARRHSWTKSNNRDFCPDHPS
ncbi:hypothetical protein [Rhodococcus sp. KRD162]|uniref:hypothetical protein n=1 Tax=Rhodococcus sp. KRD162 TaxID=2729725 RepID=UPI0019D0B22E|nr:hypothetical protein [Rhodococcus sp. KRD162]